MTDDITTAEQQAGNAFVVAVLTAYNDSTETLTDLLNLAVSTGDPTLRELMWSILTLTGMLVHATKRAGGDTQMLIDILLED